MAYNSLRNDPSRTLTLRRSYILAFRRRFVALAKSVVKYVATDDSLGLTRRDPVKSLLTNADSGDIGTDPGKVAAFRAWFKKQVDTHVLEIEDGVDPEKPWLSEYVTRAYRKGTGRGYDQVNKVKKVLTDENIFGATKLQWMRTAFTDEIAVSRLQLLATRSYTKLKGITEDMDAEMTRILIEGLAAGHNGDKIAREMVARIEGMTAERAERLARTEIIYAHAEGQLDSFERLGVGEVTLQAEWLTAGDQRVCNRCQSRAGSRLSIAEARGLIPLHPNCRCIWIPYLI